MWRMEMMRMQTLGRKIFSISREIQKTSSRECSIM
uniref:Uncharacterized protein n=1 Tax=Anguilla anguilla TaxID=7936 RepID=A0A0E9W3Y1_ANGAN